MVEKLFAKYYIQLVLYAYRLVKDKGIAEDLVQDIFLKLLEHQEKEKEITLNYLYIAVKNISLNYIRDHKHLLNATYLSEQIGTEFDPEEETERVKQLQKIYLAIEALPEVSRNIFKKVYFEHQKYTEVALELNVSVNTVKTHMYTALRSLKNKLRFYFFLFMC